MSNKLFIDTDTDEALVFGRQSTTNDANMVRFSWDSFLKRGIYLDLDSTEDADLISAIENLSWTNDVIE